MLDRPNIENLAYLETHVANAALYRICPGQGQLIRVEVQPDYRACGTDAPSELEAHVPAATGGINRRPTGDIAESIQEAVRRRAEDPAYDREPVPTLAPAAMQVPCEVSIAHGGFHAQMPRE
jgi:hypothetical protein